MPALSIRASGYYTLILMLLFVVSCSVTQAQDRPNILIAVADDASHIYFGAYGAEWLDTPAFDRVADQGVLFSNAYTPNAKCAPSRSILLTGRHSWQLEEAANHFVYFPKKFTTYAEVLQGSGYHVGYTGKGWGPGDPGTIDGESRQLLGPAYQQVRMDPPTGSITSIDYASNFEQFLEERTDGQPFHFWYGGFEPHRGYEWRSGIEKGGMQKRAIDYIPAYWPDNDTVRTDILDYGFEVEYFDRHLQRMLDILEKQGELANTLVIVTSDHGMPFPRQKSDAYEYSNHVPLAVMWADQIRNPGRTVDDFVSFIDIAPTILDVAGIDPVAAGMAPITGEPLSGILRSGKSGRVNPDRDHVLVGKERHDIGRPHDWGYPIRGIVTDRYLYIRNFKPNRWPAGNPETGYTTVAASPTKTWILYHRTDPEYHRYWQWSFGKRPAEELYDVTVDPSNVRNLLTATENPQAHLAVADRLKERLFDKLKQQGDPRMFGNGDVFEEYKFSRKKLRNFYQKYMNGELNKADVPWVNPSDFEEKGFSDLFKKIPLSSEFYGEGAAIGDLNRDGQPDVVAGPYWYEGPDFSRRHAFYEPKVFDPLKYSDNFIVDTHDVNKDGWEDILLVGFPGKAAHWYENPQEKEGYWKRHLIHPVVNNESPTFYDLSGDGIPELVFHTDGYLGYATVDPTDPTAPWSFHRISSEKQEDWDRFTHGLGVGDITGDGNVDFLMKDGWWEHPGSADDSLYSFHPVEFSPNSSYGSAQMYVYDVDGDGLNDVITSLNAHGWGLAWFQQVRRDGQIHFERNLIMGGPRKENPADVRFSQLHALDLVDINQDGLKDLVTGKRYWAHGPKGDPEPNAPAVVYWFELNRVPGGGVEFTPHLIDDDSGVGVQVVTGDLTGDGYPDIVTCNKKGTFVFLNNLKK